MTSLAPLLESFFTDGLIQQSTPAPTPCGLPDTFRLLLTFTERIGTPPWTSTWPRPTQPRSLCSFTTSKSTVATRPVPATPAWPPSGPCSATGGEGEVGEGKGEKEREGGKEGGGGGGGGEGGGGGGPEEMSFLPLPAPAHAGSSNASWPSPTNAPAIHSYRSCPPPSRQPAGRPRPAPLDRSPRLRHARPRHPDRPAGLRAVGLRCRDLELGTGPTSAASGKAARTASRR